MASGYALPSPGGSRHGHSHSYSAVHLSPERKAPNAFTHTTGLSVKKAVSNGSLYTHAELSRENSPSPSPNAEVNQQHNHYPGFEQNAYAVKENGRISAHAHHHSSPSMKSRPRGESDLGRPADPRSTVYRPALESIPAASTSWFSLPEALTSLLIPLPYVFASASYSSMTGWTAEDFPPFAVYERLSGVSLIGSTETGYAGRTRSSGFLETCILTSSTLLLVGVLSKMQSAARVLDRRKASTVSSMNLASLATTSSLKSMATRICSISLPFYAAMQLGGTRVGLIMLMAITADLACAKKSSQPAFQALKDVWSSKVATSSVIVLCFIMDEAGFTIDSPLSSVVLGYLALATSVLFLQPPFPSVPGSVSKSSSPTSKSRSWPRFPSEGIKTSAASPLTTSVGDSNATLASGVILAVFTIFSSMLVSSPPSISTSTITLTTFTVAAMAASILFSSPTSLRSESKAGLALGCLTTASCSFLFSPSLWPGTVCNGGLSALSLLGVLYDTYGDVSQHTHTHEHHDQARNVHTHHSHHSHQHSEPGHSAFTKFVIARCEPDSLVYSILSEKDSRRIAYFTVLNFGFMIVQGAYGYLSGSLGLLSDTVHMFFDCLGLVVGLGAAVASKWPTSPEKPYGWGKLNTLAGFGNGVFLMLVSIEFVWEAIEGILEQRELRHVEELLVVSTLGLLVNLVGLFAFGHAHAGHHHGHEHSHSHSHSHSHEHEHAHDHSHGLPNGHAHSHDCAPSHSHAHHDHGHHNENMHGIFLHVAADAGGSLAVILSTALTLWNPWYLWDPLATIIIAVLIFAAAVPLVVSSGQKLLLVIPDELEYTIKTALQELGELRGVVGYAAPRFWIDDKDSAGDAHGHHHGHDHGGGGRKLKVMGVIHVIAAPGADLEDVRERVVDFFATRRIDLVVHVEREGEQCWCGEGAPKSS